MLQNILCSMQDTGDYLATLLKNLNQSTSDLWVIARSASDAAISKRYTKLQEIASLRSQ